MLDITKDIQTLTTFRRRSGDLMKQLKKSKRPVVLTVKGKAEAVVQDAEAYQRLLDLAALADAREGIRQGLGQAVQGQGRDAEEILCRVRSGPWHIGLSSCPAWSGTLLTFTAAFKPKRPMPPEVGMSALAKLMIDRSKSDIYAGLSTHIRI